MGTVTYSPLLYWLKCKRDYVRAQTHLYGWKWVLGVRIWNGRSSPPPRGWI